MDIRRKFVTPLSLLLAAVSPLALAQNMDMQSDWMEFVKGHRDTKLGIEVREVTTDPETGDQSVVVAIPKGAIGNETAIEEVVVVGKAPQKVERGVLFPELETQWVDDYDNDNYGLLIKLTKDQAMPFRLFFTAAGQGGAIDNSVESVQP